MSHSSSEEFDLNTLERGETFEGPLIQRPTLKAWGEKQKESLKYRCTTKAGWLETLYSLMPVFYWIPRYSARDNIMGDLIAGLSVGVMLVPQGMAYAVVAGLPPVYGMYTALVPIYIYALFGTSRQLSVGPVAVMSLLINQTVSTIVDSNTNPDDYIRITLSISLIVGIIDTILGFLQMGWITNFISPPVLTGFTSAAAIIIFCQQLKDLFGIAIPRTNYFYLNIYYVIERLPQTIWLSFVIGICTFLSLSFLQKWKPVFPWILLVVVLDTAISFGIHKHTDGVLPIVGSVPGGLPSPKAPSLSSEEFVAVLPTAIIITLVGFLESISISKKYAEIDGYPLRPSQELIALGLANLIGGFFLAYPATGSFSRTAVKYLTGSKSQISALVAGTVVLLTLLFLTPLFYYIPKTTLSAVVMTAIIKLVDIDKIILFWKVSPKDWAICMVTLIAGLAADIDVGIGVGIGFSILVVIYESTLPHTAQLGNISPPSSSPNYRNIKRNRNAKLEDDIVIVRVDSALYFANSLYVGNKLEKYLESNLKIRSVKFFIIEFLTIHSIDYAGIQMLRNFQEKLKKKKVRLYLAGVKGSVSDALVRNKLVQEFGKQSFFSIVPEAVTEAKRIIEHEVQFPPKEEREIPMVKKPGIFETCLAKIRRS